MFFAYLLVGVVRFFDCEGGIWMKGSAKLLRQGVLFALPVCALVLGWLAYDMLSKGHFRVTCLIGLVFFAVLVWAAIRGFAKKEDGKLVWFAALQCWYWAFFDYGVGILLGHFETDTVSINAENPLAMQLLCAFIACALLVLLFPLAKRLHAHNKRKNANLHRGSTLSMLSVLAVGLVIALYNNIKNNIKFSHNPTLDPYIIIVVFLYAFLAFGVGSLVCLLSHLDPNEPTEEKGNKTILL